MGTFWLRGGTCSATFVVQEKGRQASTLGLFSLWLKPFYLMAGEELNRYQLWHLQTILCMCVWLCMCLHMRVHVEARGQWAMSSYTTFHHILRQFIIEAAFNWWGRLAGQRSLGICLALCPGARVSDAQLCLVVAWVLETQTQVLMHLQLVCYRLNYPTQFWITYS